MVIIPQKMFSTPVLLFKYLNSNKINILLWAPSALILCAGMDVFSEVELSTIDLVVFAGSAMPCKYLRVWQKNLPRTMFVNQYGQTEGTSGYMFYIVDHLVEATEILPIGKPIDNTSVYLLDESGSLVPDGEVGEICVRGSRVALGYYNNPEMTHKSFVANPFNSHYRETIYKSGDLAVKRLDGNYVYHGRKDFQIKHMGHRIELGEIEAVALFLEGVDRCCCLFHEQNDRIVLFYTGAVDHKELAIHMRKGLPGYMVPRKFIKLENLPLNDRGKPDYAELKEKMLGL